MSQQTSNCTIRITKPQMPTLGEIAPAAVDLGGLIAFVPEQSDGGNYNCTYHVTGDQEEWSESVRPKRIICLLCEVDGKVQAVGWDGPDENTLPLSKLMGHVVQMHGGQICIVSGWSRSDSRYVCTCQADGRTADRIGTAVPKHDLGPFTIEQAE